MADLIQTYLPNVYKMGWLGQAGWGTAIYLTLYMTVFSFIIGGFLGLVAGLFLVLTAPGGVLEDKFVFWVLDKITSIFRAVPFIILLAVLSPFSHLIVGTSIGPNAAIVPLSFAVFAFFAFGTTGPILLMWLTPQAYIATLVARGKSQDYIDRVMVAPNSGTILLFVASVLIGALLGALIGQVLIKKISEKKPS